MGKETPTRITFKRSAALFMAFVCAISLLAVTGWLFNRPILASFNPEFIPMAPASALIFLGLCGAWLIQRVFPARHGMRKLVQAVLLGLLIIVLILAIRFFTGYGLDLEKLLYPTPPLFGQISSARMSPLSALGFLLGIPAFLLLTGGKPGQRTKSASAALSLVLFSFSGLICVGYLFRAPLFYGGTLIPMAATSALSFLFLSLGLLMMAGPACWPVRMYVGPSLIARLRRVFIPASILIVLLQGFLITAADPWIINPALKVAVAVTVASLTVALIISMLAKNLSAEIERGNQARIRAENILKQSEASLRESEAKYRALVDEVSDGIYICDLHGSITFSNRALARILGVEQPEAVIGRNFLEFVPPEKAAALREQYQAALAAGKGSSLVTTEVIRQDGSRAFVEVRPQVIVEAGQPVGNRGTLSDVTERMQSHEALRQSEAELRALFASMHDAVLVIDRDGVYREIAPTNPKLLVKPPEELLGKSLRDFFPPEQAESHISVVQQVLDTKQTAQIEYDLIIGDQTVQFEASISPMTEDSTLWVAHDITKRKRFESVQSAMYKITQAALTSEGIDTLYRSIHSILGELIPAENFFIALYNSASNLISFPYFVDQYDEPPPAAKQFRGLTGYVIRSGRPLLATREILDQLVKQGEVEVVGTASEDWLGAPLKVEGRIIGVLAVQSYTQGIHYNQEDLNLLEFVSTQVALAIERKRMEMEIRGLSLTDDLTGLRNRRGFTLLAEQEVKLAHRIKRSMLLFFGDVDDLKEINDSFGHTQGDLALMEVAALLKETFREADILARFGGDEFVVLAVDAAFESADILTNRVQDILEAHNQQGDRLYHLTLSIGITRYDPEAPCTVSELIAQADGLMYDQKLTGKAIK